MRDRRRRRDSFSNRKRIGLSILPLLFSSVFLVVGTYAWFIYYSNVESSMTGHVVGWKIEFTDQNTSTDLNVDVSRIYPGMDDFESSLTITNSGETAASVSSLIKSITVLGTTYSVGDLVDGKELTAADIIKIIEDTYPFTFGYDFDDDVLDPGESTNFNVNVVWPYESYTKVSADDTYDELQDYYISTNGRYVSFRVASAAAFNTNRANLYYSNDLLDTTWGENANKYIKENPNTPCISLVLQVDAVQYIED